MKKVYSDVIQFKGTHFDFGMYQGELLKNSPLMRNQEAMYHRFTQKFTVDVPFITQLLNTYAPHLINEIEGLAQTLSFTMEKAFLHFAGYYASPKSGCSITTRPSYMIRNYDNAPDTYDGRFVLFSPTDSGFSSMGPSMQVTGRMDGLNEKGLAIGYNFVNTRNNRDGFVCNMIGRLLLERCQNTDEAIQLLRDIPHKHSFNYVLLDAERNSKIVEASPRQISVREATACTNHFNILTEENRYRMEDSLAREQVISDAQQQTLSIKEAFELLNGVERGVFATKYGAWDGTLHTAGYIPSERKAIFALGGDTLPVLIDFEAWIQGKRLALTKLKGALDAKDGFANE
ncbi:C45 family peptidase [Solibacillus sp. FSL K6-1523]|uniref:C45 family peptidase n=1 Tax=Solibacillus sp. FSL K6-1523 TaxID=2921471 RepID=UPI0030F5630D